MVGSNYSSGLTCYLNMNSLAPLSCIQDVFNFTVMKPWGATLTWHRAQQTTCLLLVKGSGAACLSYIIRWPTRNQHIPTHFPMTLSIIEHWQRHRCRVFGMSMLQEQDSPVAWYIFGPRWAASKLPTVETRVREKHCSHTTCNLSIYSNISNSWQNKGNDITDDLIPIRLI